MNLINLSVDNIPGPSWPILLGERKENAVTEVRLDYSAWIAEFGPGAITLMVKRPGDADAYPVALETADGVAIWTVSETDTAVKGAGRAEYVYTVGQQRAKTAVFATLTDPDIGEAGSTPPDPYEDWVETLTELGAETLQNAQDAAQSAENAEAWAVGERGGEPVSRTDETFENNAKFYAERAEQAAEGAGYVWFDVDQDDGEMYVTIADDLSQDVAFAVNVNTGELEVTYS